MLVVDELDVDVPVTMPVGQTHSTTLRLQFEHWGFFSSH